MVPAISLLTYVSGSDKTINELAKQVKSFLQPSAESQDVGKGRP
jgi:hypothetical protein